MSTTVMKSVPSPGSPCQTPLASIPSDASCSSAGVSVLPSFCAFIFSCNCLRRFSSLFSCCSSALKAASGTSSLLSWLITFCSTGFSGSVCGSSSVSAMLCFCFSSMAALAAAMASSSALDLRPLCLGIEARNSSGDMGLSCLGSVCSYSSSLKGEG